jgi:hypothetical protein
MSEASHLMYPEETAYENKILDLTCQEDEWEEQEGPDYICDHCEIPMRKAEEDLSSATDGRVIIKRGSYFCSQCGIVWHSLDQQQQRVIKSQEKTGPRIPKPEFFFESIPSISGLEPKHHTDQFDLSLTKGST